VSATNPFGFTALHNLLRAPAAPVEAFQLVIQQGADTNPTDTSGRTPLMVCLNEHTDKALPLEQIAVLISAGADCSRVSRKGVSFLEWCVLATDGDTALLKLLLRGGADVNYTDSEGQTARYSAVSSGNFEAVQLLLTAGSDVHHRDNMNMTPLFMVRSLPVLNLLLAAGADVQAVSSAGLNALHCLCVREDIKPTAAVVCGLIKAGVDLTACSNGPNGCTPVQFAQLRGHTLIAQLLARAERDYHAKAHN
jgi:uncharacterized protein